MEVWKLESFELTTDEEIASISLNQNFYRLQEFHACETSIGDYMKYGSKKITISLFYNSEILKMDWKETECTAELVNKCFMQVWTCGFY